MEKENGNLKYILGPHCHSIAIEVFFKELALVMIYSAYPVHTSRMTIFVLAAVGVGNREVHVYNFHSITCNLLWRRIYFRPMS
jgi:hypothetical protein